MSNPKHISSLIGEIYDAILDRARGTEALGKAAQFVGAQAAALLWRNPVCRTANVIHAFGIEPRYVDLYRQHYAKLDPTTAPMFLRDVGEVATTTDLLPHSELHKTCFYEKWLQPQGFVDTLQASLDKSATDFVYLCFMRNGESGIFDNAARDRLRLIIPHLRRAVLVGQLVDRTTAQAATFGDALDGICAGLFLVDAGGQIVHANASGHAMLAQGVLVRGSSGKLTTHDTSAAQGLSEIFSSAATDRASSGPQVGAVPLTGRGGEHYVAHVLSLSAGVRRLAGADDRAVAALFVQKASRDLPSPQNAIAKLYRLTPTELRVLAGIVQVGGAPEVALAMGISVSTVKTHLRRLFAKTGTDRQADLVKLVAGYANPLVA
jgi:DNA-binding CsgD family transcriptional regulator